MKKILIIGAGFLQSFVIKKAKEMGYYTIAIDKNPNSVGFEFADEFGIVDIVDQGACFKFAYEKCVDGVMTAATDYGVLSAAYIAEKLGLPGLDYSIAKIIKNKYLIRRVFKENQIDDISQYYEVGDIEDINRIINKISYPVMVKPCDGSGSKAAKRIDNKEKIKEVCKDAISSSMIGKAIIEDFIIGKEYGVESFVYKDEVNIVGIINKTMTSPPDYAELGHMMPSGFYREDKIKDIVKKAIEVLGINFGAINMDIIVTQDNRICIVDVGARMGGNLIGSHIIPKSTGYDYLGSLIKAAMNDEVILPNNMKNDIIATQILALKSGIITSLPDFYSIEKKYDVTILHNIKAGDIIREYHNNLDGCGYILSVGSSVSEAARKAMNAKDAVDNGISRK